MALKNEHLRALNILALYNVESNSYEAWYRHLCRWYSREFSTPLEQVMELSEETVITTYFEDSLWQLKSQPGDDAHTRYEEIRQSILLTPEELQEIEEDDDRWVEEELRRVEQENTAKAQKKEQNPNLNKEESYIISGQDFDFIPDSDDWGD